MPMELWGACPHNFFNTAKPIFIFAMGNLNRAVNQCVILL